MKLLRYGPAGQEKPGVLDAQGRVRDLSGHIADLAGSALLPDTLARLGQLDVDSLPLVPGTPQHDLRLGPCVGAVGKFICIGLNYSDHAAEAGMQVPPEPVVFNKWTSAICGPDDDVQIPRGSVKTDWEVELGVVIGTGGRYIAEADAMRHVAGYCVVNDVSEREFQIERSGTWDKGKGCDTFGPLGPWLVTPDEVPDPQALAPVAGGGWPAQAGRQHRHHGLPGGVFDQLPEPLHESAKWRCDLDRHAARRGHGPQAAGVPARRPDHAPGRARLGDANPARGAGLSTKDFAWALIGPGSIAHRFADAVHQLPDTYLHTVVGRNLGKAQAFANTWTRGRCAHTPSHR